jgi:Tol biopolymer transport system component
MVSLGADGNPGNADSYNPVISPDGQFVAFVSLATNLVSGASVDGVTPQVYLRTICGGTTPLTPPGTTTTCAPTTYLVSSPDGIAPGNGASSYPTIGNAGTFISFISTASNLGVPNPSKAQEIFEQNECQLATTGCVPTMTLISTPDGTTAAGGANLQPNISYDGRFVAFSSTAANLGVAAAGIQQIYVRDTCAGVTTTCTPSTKLVSTPNGTTPANGLSESPSINGDSSGSGQFIAFASQASNLSTNTANGVENIFVRNTCNTLASTTTACVPGTALASHANGTSAPAADGNSVAPAISPDGHTVAFISFANDLVPLDTNAVEDIFLGATTF